MNTSFRPLLAEFLGTALFVFIAAGSVVANAMTSGGLTTVGIALAQGAGYAVLASALMNISGGHLNPAISFGVWVVGKIDGSTFGRYVFAQLAGGVAGAALVRGLFPSVPVEAVSAGVPQLSIAVGFVQGAAIEAVFTFVLLIAVLATVTSRDAPRMGGFGIGLAVFVGSAMAGGLTGGAFNPARAIGPALVSWTWHSQAAYWIGPLAGAALAGWMWRGLSVPGGRGTNA